MTNPPMSLDHSPIILMFKPIVGDSDWGIFKYELYWEDHEECNKIITDSWSLEGSEHDPWKAFINKTKSCKRKLAAWNPIKFKNTAKEIVKMKKKSSKLVNHEGFEIDFIQINILKEEIRRLWEQEEKYRGQRSRLK